MYLTLSKPAHLLESAHPTLSAVAGAQALMSHLPDVPHLFQPCAPSLSCPPLPLLHPQDLIGRLLERRPARRIGMLNGRAQDIKNHKWFEGFNWAEMEARR